MCQLQTGNPNGPLTKSPSQPLCVVTQHSSPQTAAHIQTTFHSRCFFCGLLKGPIMYQQSENDATFHVKKKNRTSGRLFRYSFLSPFSMADKTKSLKKVII